MGNWLTRNQAQELISAASKNSLRGWRDGAILGLLLGYGLRRSEVVGLNLDQLQSREGHWVIVNLVGKGGRLRNRTCAVLVQGTCRCMAPAFGSERRKSIQAIVEGRSSGRNWRDGQRRLVHSEAMRRSGRHKQSGSPRSSAHMRPILPWVRRRTGADSVSAWSRFRANNGTLYRSKQKLQDAVNDRLGISVASDTP
jgi:site-specific recombinase XerC